MNIYRKTNIRKEDREDGLWFMAISDRWLRLAQEEKRKNGITCDYAYKLNKSIKALEIAAKFLGFKCVSDMKIYMMLNGKL